jgi:hypothetical protein
MIPNAGPHFGAGGDTAATGESAGICFGRASRNQAPMVKPEALTFWAQTL